MLGLLICQNYFLHLEIPSVLDSFSLDLYCKQLRLSMHVEVFYTASSYRWSGVHLDLCIYLIILLPYVTKGPLGPHQALERLCDNNLDLCIPYSYTPVPQQQSFTAVGTCCNPKGKLFQKNHIISFLHMYLFNSNILTNKNTRYFFLSFYR